MTSKLPIITIDGIQYDLVPKSPVSSSSEGERDWEILSFVTKDGWPAVKDSPLWKIHGGESKGIISFKTCLENFSISKVKRLRDGEVFSIGDEVGSKHKDKATINRFRIIGDEMIVYFDEIQVGCDISWLTPAPAKVEREPLFITEDGIEIFKGDQGKIWRVFTLENTSYETWKPFDLGMPQYKNLGEKFFRTQEAANNYILTYKPVLSSNDIYTIIIQLSQVNDRDINKYDYNEQIKKSVFKLVQSRINP